MKLRRLHVGRLPGIDEPFTLKDLGEGLHIVVGPNGIGKSSLCRAARALLWKEFWAAEGVSATALFEHEGVRFVVEREGKRQSWQRDGVDAEPPPLPPSHLERCFFLGLRDLLDSSGTAGQDVASEIRRQMSGGFDLEGAARSVFAPFGTRHGSKERSELSRLDGEISAAVRKQDTLAQRESTVQALEREATEADAAQREIPHLVRALQLHELRAKRDAMERVLGAFPEALARLTGNETAQIDEREGEIARLLARRVRVEHDLARAQREQEATRLTGAVEPAQISTWRAKADHLGGLALRLEEAQRVWDSERSALATASQALGGHPEPSSAIDLADGHDLFVFLREAWQARQGVDALRQQLALLAERSFPPREQQRLALLRRGGEALRAWLRAPDPGAGIAPIAGLPRWQAIALAGAALLIVGAALAAAVDPSLAWLAAAGVGLGAAAWLLRPDARAGWAREAAVRDLPSGIASPPAWETAPVGERLLELEREQAELEAAATRARDRAVERASVETSLREAEARDVALAARRLDLADALGLHEVPPDAELVDTARVLDQLRQARAAERAAAAQVESLGAQHGSLLAEIAFALMAHGEPEPADAAAAQARVAGLNERSANWRAARDEQQRLRDELAEIDRDVEQHRDSIAALYRSADLEPGHRAEFQRLLDQRGTYREKIGERDACLIAIQHAESELDAAGRLHISASDAATLEVEKARCETQTSGLGDLRTKIATLRAEVRQAREGHQLEDLLGARGDKVHGLQEKRDEALRAAAGRFLLCAVREEHENVQMPRVLARARALFATFTHGSYELRVAPDDSGSFVAIETRSGAGRAPDALSDGTRAQLLLAARLAFAEEAERGTRLPLFLDEALDQSDPVRFHAIARSLARMVADEDRQIFYLTNDPVDVQRIQAALREEGCTPAAVIDLAAVRGHAAMAAAPAAARIEPLPQVLAPAGQTAEGYAASLGVPHLDPPRGAQHQHLFHLLHDDLELLHSLLERRIAYVGQWQTLSRLQAEVVVQLASRQPASSELDARAELLAEFCRAFCEGRGRPVDRDTLERSGEVSERYLDAVCEIARELGGNGKALLEMLKARGEERLRGFQVRRAEALEGFLVEAGCIDARPVLGEQDVVTRVMAAPPAPRIPGPVLAELVHRWWVSAERTNSG